jgi:hypothetical protein
MIRWCLRCKLQTEQVCRNYGKDFYQWFCMRCNRPAWIGKLHEQTSHYVHSINRET